MLIMFDFLMITSMSVKLVSVVYECVDVFISRLVLLLYVFIHYSLYCIAACNGKHYRTKFYLRF